MGCFTALNFQANEYLNRRNFASVEYLDAKGESRHVDGLAGRRPAPRTDREQKPTRIFLRSKRKNLPPVFSWRLTQRNLALSDDSSILRSPIAAQFHGPILDHEI